MPRFATRSQKAPEGVTVRRIGYRATSTSPADVPPQERDGCPDCPRDTEIVPDQK
ncbi:hypothetical protein [Streptomyces nitrosporeus]|uniref:hypothetical protein n=1 Tax=Streptomyces nitrosporeus TaxID=28894 RepID=UPI00167E7B41|nr:hypothetical protein [Streptomyces nitrosporeus]